MAGFGMALGGFGEAYPQFKQQQMERQMQQQKLKEALVQMAQQQKTQQETSAALPQFAKLQGSGPGGIVTPQQIAGLTNNPDAFNALISANQKNNAGMYNLQGREVSQQGANERNIRTNNTREDIVDRQQAGAGARTNANIAGRDNVVKQQQAGANSRNAASATSRSANSSSRPAAAAAKGNTPEYKTAVKEFDEASKYEQSIQNNYGRMGNFTGYLNDPEWLAARKRKISAQSKMEKVSAKEGTDTQPAPAAPKGEPLPKGAESFPDGTEIPDSTGQVWVKQGNVLVPKQ